MRIRKLAGLAATAIALAGAAAPSALASNPDYDYGTFQVKTRSGLAVDVYGASKADGAAVVQWQINGGDNQRWRFVPINGHHQLRSVNSRMCLTAATTPGSAVFQSRCTASETQQWDVESTQTGDTLNNLTIRSVASNLFLTAPANPAVYGPRLRVDNLRYDPAQSFDLTTSVL
jgi:hypothetical protein